MTAGCGWRAGGWWRDEHRGRPNWELVARTFLLGAACFAPALIVCLFVTWRAWRATARDIPFRTFYAATHRYVGFRVAVPAMEWKAVRIAGRPDVIRCQRLILAISAIAISAYMVLLAAKW